MLTYAVRQENEQVAYHTLERPSATYHGIAYEARALRRQSLHSSLRMGKPSTQFTARELRRRETGHTIMRKERYA